MLADRYEMALSTTSPAARDAYVAGCELLLAVYPGALDAFDRAVAADPGFALAHVRRAQVFAGIGDAAAAREAMAAAHAVSAGLAAWEASHIAFFDLFCSGNSTAALSALQEHLKAWPRDALALTTTAFTNGLIGSAGRVGVKREMVGLLDSLAGSYGDDWWFMAHHGMALSEDGQPAAAHAKIDRSIALNAHNGWAAHARTHWCYENGDPAAARAFLAPWLIDYPRNAALFSHLNWHLALSDLEAGDEAEASRLYREAFALDVHAGPPRAKITDGVSFLWRRELAGYPRDDEAWRMLHGFAIATLPRPGAALADTHVALAQVVAGDGAAVEARARQVEDLARDGRYASGHCVPALTRAFAAFEKGDLAAAIEALQPIVAEIERIGGSRAQLDLLEFTLLKAYVDEGRTEDARRMMVRRRSGPSRIPVAGIKAKDGRLAVEPHLRPRHTLAGLLAASNYSEPQAIEGREWVDAPTVGHEPK